MPDETAVRVGEIRGQIWVTRRENEAYHKDCTNKRSKQYTELMFGGAYTTELKGPYYMLRREPAAEKKMAHRKILTTVPPATTPLNSS